MGTLLVILVLAIWAFMAILEGGFITALILALIIGSLWDDIKFPENIQVKTEVVQVINEVQKDLKEASVSPFRKWSAKHSDYDLDHSVTEEEYQRFRAFFMNQYNLRGKDGSDEFFDTDGNRIPYEKLKEKMDEYDRRYG